MHTTCLSHCIHITLAFCTSCKTHAYPIAFLKRHFIKIYSRNLLNLTPLQLLPNHSLIIPQTLRALNYIKFNVFKCSLIAPESYHKKNNKNSVCFTNTISIHKVELFGIYGNCFAKTYLKLPK
jgi:hypothetical protein